MSLATFKQKTINLYSSATNRSGKPPGGVWLPQGPFGRPTSLTSVMLLDALNGPPGPVGFSLAGSRRFISVGKDMKMSRSGTRFRGQYAVGNGGCCGQYYRADPVMNACLAKVEVNGNQYRYIKPSTLSSRGMIAQSFRWIQSGQYPNAWVQPIYTGNQTASASQGVYIHTLSAQNTCVVDVNNDQKYVGYRACGGPTGCSMTPARGYKMVVQTRNAPYTKFLANSQDASQQTLNIQRKCANPSSSQKPFPYAVQTGTGVLRGGTSVDNVANACGTSNVVLRAPSGTETND